MHWDSSANWIFMYYIHFQTYFTRWHYFFLYYKPVYYCLLLHKLKDLGITGLLLHKLKDLGITGKLGIWFFQFLTNRTHYVIISGGISKDSPVLSGVPQGTVLGPLLFLIMISDINKGITSSKLVNFADDTRVCSNIAEADDYDNLQYDLNSIYNWAVHNNMFLTLKSFITFHLVNLCLLIVILYMPIQIWKS